MDSKPEKTIVTSPFEKPTGKSGRSYEPIMTAEDEVIIESLEEVWERLE